MSAADLPALPELKRATAADVHKAGTHVATLTRSPAGEVTFAYLPGHRGDAVVGFQRCPPCERKRSQLAFCVSENDGDARAASAKTPLAPVLRERKRSLAQTLPLRSRCQ